VSNLGEQAEALPPQARALHAMNRLFQTTLGPVDESSTVGRVLDRRVDLVWQEHLDGHRAAAELLRTAGGSRRYDEAVSRGLTVDDVRAAIAREHGFADWAGVTAERDRPMDRHFEAAVDAIVSGDLDTVHTLLNAHPDLVRARSPFGHHATLVHYIAANGVEMSRQWQSPRNAVGILRILLRHGADPDAVCDTYGGGPSQTPLCLLVSSTHPAVAGVQAGLVEELCHGGANPDGRDDDGLPLWTAITFGYRDAVDALARSGARVDNLVFAAAVGDLARVEAYLRGDERVTGKQARSAQRIGAHGPLLDSNHLIEYALIYSAGLGRRAVVEALLASGPDLGVTEPVFHGTAAGAARYQQRHDILALLEAT
jgi:ankyrin repeat protein